MRTNTGWTRRVRLRASLWLIIAAALGGSAPAVVSAEPSDDMNSTYANIVVEFVATVWTPGRESEETAPDEALADVAADILARLAPEVRESARVFEHLPLIALAADAETMLRLIAMPEVLAIQPDRDIRVLPTIPADGVSATLGDITLTDDDDTIAVPQVTIDDLEEGRLHIREDDAEAKPQTADEQATR